MRPRQQHRIDLLALRAAAMAVLCAGVLYWRGEDQPSRQLAPSAAADRSEPAPRSLPAAGDGLSTQVQTVLAEAGCPGWIAVANHPEWLQSTADEQYVSPLPPVHDAVDVTLAADGPAVGVPQLRYPVPIRLAARPPAITTTMPADNPDDLLGGVEDLVAPLPGANATPPSTAPEGPRRGEFNFNGPPAAQASPSDENESPAAQEIQLDESDAAGSPSASAAPKSSGVAIDDEDLLAPARSGRQAPRQPEALPRPPGAIAPESAEPSPPAGDSLFMPPPAGAPNPHTAPRRPPARPQAAVGADGTAAPKTPLERCEFVAKSLYPAATECRACHEQIYEEWSMSSHAYAMVSPMFHKFEQTINDVAQGTIGYFCYRCHSPAGTSLGISRAAPLWDLPQVAREGVTCVACHRVNEFYGRTNGERRIVPGDIYDPVYGSIGGGGVAAAIRQQDDLKLKLSPDDKGPGQPMHRAGFYNPQLGTSDFCITCHQVAVYPGIKLEVVWEQYRASPACKKGIRCQDCHMGRIPGVPSGFEYGPAAVINKKNVNDRRRHSNHVFYGPGYSIAHPGVFPFNPKAYRWTERDWLLFDWRAGWGTDEFEDAVADGRVQVAFPDVWKESDDRCDAREIIEDNLKKRAVKDRLRTAVMENGSHVDGPFFKNPPARGQQLEFDYIVINTNEGHNLPTASLGAQPQLWANVALVGPRGKRLWETGYLDSLGDLADIHSEDVRHKRIAYDWQLFNLQTMFLITGAKGTDREFFLPVNIDFDQLPFIRPGAQPISVINHPPFIRMEARSLAPLGSRRVPYRVPAELLCEPGRYRLTFRMRSRLEPLYFMRFCGATPEMMRAMTEGILDFHESSVEFVVR